MYLNPDELTNLINGNQRMKRAMNVLLDRWDVVDDNPFMPDKIDAATIDQAKRLAQTKLVKTKVNFTDYQSVQQFILHNNSYIDNGAKERLLRPFN